MTPKEQRLITNSTKLNVVENIIRNMIFDDENMNEQRDAILLEVVRLSRKLEEVEPK